MIPLWVFPNTRRGGKPLTHGRRWTGKSLPRINGFPPLSADSNFKKRLVQNICHGNGAPAALRPEAGTSRASASCRIAPHNRMTFTFEVSGVTVPLHFRFCNPPARAGWPRSVCMAYQCRRWKENVSTFDAKRLSSSMQAILPVQVDCKTLKPRRQQPAMVSDDCHEWGKQKPAPRNGSRLSRL